MLRKFALIFIMSAMAMITFATVTPHHHHHACVYLASECPFDGHEEGNGHGEDESNCVSQEKYVSSESLRVDNPETSQDVGGIDAALSFLAIVYEALSDNEPSFLTGTDIKPLNPKPPVLSSSGANAPPADLS